MRCFERMTIFWWYFTAVLSFAALLIHLIAGTEAFSRWWIIVSCILYLICRARLAIGQIRGAGEIAEGLTMARIWQGRRWPSRQFP